MALPAGGIIEIRDTGNNNNGGGYLPGAGVDYSQQASPQAALTTASSAGAGDVVLDAASDANWVNNYCTVVSGTNFTVGTYLIIAVTPGVSFQVDRAITTGVGANGVINVGGAWANPTDAQLEKCVAGNIVYIKKGASAYSTGAIALTAAGTHASVIRVIGYNSTRGDAPTIASGNQPILDLGGNNFTSGTLWHWENLTFTTTVANGIQSAASCKFINCKATNSSGTAGRAAFRLSAVDSLIINCEASSTNGVAVQCTAQVSIDNCYIHSSSTGISTTNAAGSNILNCVIANITSKGLDIISASTSQGIVKYCTFYGAATPTGSSIGIDIVTGTNDMRVTNCIFYGWVKGIQHADVQNSHFSNYNCFYNNTTNRTNWLTGPNDVAVDPQFTNAAGNDFSVGTNLKALGSPATFGGSNTISYQEIGAVQRKEKVSTDPGIANVLDGVNYTIDDVSLEGELVAQEPPVQKMSDTNSGHVYKLSVS